MQENNNTDPDLVKRLKKFTENWRSAVDTCMEPKGKFLSIIHNDAWCNNFMFK